MDDEVVVTLEELEELIESTHVDDINTLVGLVVKYPVGAEDDYMQVKTALVGAYEIGLAMTFTCTTCGKPSPEVQYVCRGAPGWCYVFSKDGAFLADLRNQEYRCDEHG